MQIVRWLRFRCRLAFRKPSDSLRPTECPRLRRKLQSQRSLRQLSNPRPKKKSRLRQFVNISQRKLSANWCRMGVLPSIHRAKPVASGSLLRTQMYSRQFNVGAHHPHKMTGRTSDVRIGYIAVELSESDACLCPLLRQKRTTVAKDSNICPPVII
jgi:hypothetical protein